MLIQILVCLQVFVIFTVCIDIDSKINGHSACPWELRGSCKLMDCCTGIKLKYKSRILTSCLKPASDADMHLKCNRAEPV